MRPTLTGRLAGLLVACTCATAVATEDSGSPLSDALVAAESAIRRALGSGAASTDVAAERLDARLRLTPCAGPLAATLGSPLRARDRRATVRVSCSGPTPWKLYVNVRVSRRIDVPVIARPLQSGNRVSSNDIVMESRVLSELPAGALTDAAALIGQELRQPVLPGDVVQRFQIRNPVIVRRGQFVTIESSSGPIVVKMGGIVQSEGTQGGIVSVRNRQSGRLVQARVLDGSRVASLGAGVARR